MKGFFLFIVACFSFCVICPLAITHAVWRNRLDFIGYAISIDQTINAVAKELLNALFLKDKALFNFGDMDKTISYNLGMNKHFGNLNRFGVLVCDLLHFLDPKHVERSYEDEV